MRRQSIQHRTLVAASSCMSCRLPRSFYLEPFVAAVLLVAPALFQPD